MPGKAENLIKLNIFIKYWFWLAKKGFHLYFGKVQVQRVAHLSNKGHIPTTDGSSNIKLNSMKTKVLSITTKI